MYRNRKSTSFVSNIIRSDLLSPIYSFFSYLFWTVAVGKRNIYESDSIIMIHKGVDFLDTKPSITIDFLQIHRVLCCRKLTHYGSESLREIHKFSNWFSVEQNPLYLYRGFCATKNQPFYRSDSMSPIHNFFFKNHTENLQKKKKIMDPILLYLIQTRYSFYFCTSEFYNFYE